MKYVIKAGKNLDNDNTFVETVTANGIFFTFDTKPGKFSLLDAISYILIHKKEHFMLWWSYKIYVWKE